ncbi:MULTISPECIES: tetratricopeptide repeat protein [Staphylococcus]|uniref:Tetratricopeptide repeat protein n=1 Tax=Staphylococcus agnetis TaxID=985762 RepID=A0A2T4MLA8_9STAP|nr:MULTISPECIES: tetratricopeptide repeat protein [Staphylococcus]ALN75860.1 tetratricopeptide repeat protein [Staphylococcus agnetis]MDG4943062.1 tetratricopeptide repeat protein [Staphylococcus agnetis]NHM92127.1 tetratricopeptide repeat protein [Staphylococcus sp. 10602379]NJI01973.1 tetratricopeptide repeat protein [Staphylococcus agnetis]NJI13407.1 tetratricopeptide repeat protein [Staphylococcus agnetis]
MTQHRKIIQLGTDVALYERLAHQKMLQQEYAKAKKYLDKVLELSPDNFDAKQQLATCYVKLRQPKKAEAIYYEALSKDDEIETCLYELSQLNIDLNEPNKAYLFGLRYAFLTQDEDYRDELEHMFEVTLMGDAQLELESELFVAQIIFQYLFGQGRLLDAREYILNQETHIKNHRVMRNLLAMCYLYLNENKEAKAMFETLLEEDASDVHALCHYTLLLYNMNETKQYAHYIKVLNKIIPMNDDQSFKLGTVLSYLKQYEASQQLLLPLHRKGSFQTFQLFHALSFNYYYLGQPSQSEHFWKRLQDFAKATPGVPPWIMDTSETYFNEHIAPLLTSDDGHRRLYGLFLLHQLNGKEVLMTKDVWSILEDMGDYEKLYLSYLIQGLQLRKLNFIHKGMQQIYQISETKDETALFLSWINYAESLLETDVDTDNVNAYTAAVSYLYFNTTNQSMLKSKLSEMFGVSEDKLERALAHLLSI